MIKVFFVLRFLSALVVLGFAGLLILKVLGVA
jgi:hypothetical protein